MIAPPVSTSPSASAMTRCAASLPLRQRLIDDDVLQQQIAQSLLERRVNALSREGLPNIFQQPKSRFRSSGSYIITVFFSSAQMLHAGLQNKHFHPLYYARLRFRNGLLIVKASGRIPFSTSFQVTGAAIGKPGRTRGEYAPTAVVPRPLRK
jgi:hypothetical protein